MSADIDIAKAKGHDELNEGIKLNYFVLYNLSKYQTYPQHIVSRRAWQYSKTTMYTNLASLI